MPRERDWRVRDEDDGGGWFAGGHVEEPDGAEAEASERGQQHLLQVRARRVAHVTHAHAVAAQFVQLASGRLVLEHRHARGTNKSGSSDEEATAIESGAMPRVRRRRHAG